MSRNRSYFKLTYPTVLLKRFGIGVKWVETNDPEDFRKAIDEKTKAVYIESISNPRCRVPNISGIAKVNNLRIHHHSSCLIGECLGRS